MGWGDIIYKWKFYRENMGKVLGKYWEHYEATCVNGHDSGTDSLEVFTIYKASFSAYESGYPHKIPEIHIDQKHAMNCHNKYACSPSNMCEATNMVILATHTFGLTRNILS